MSSFCLSIAAALLTATPAFQVTATLKSVDPEGRQIVVEGGGQDRHLTVPADVHVLDADGHEITEGLRSDKLKPGLRLAISVERGPSGPMLKSIRLAGGAAAGGSPGKRATPSAGSTPLDPNRFDTSPLVPLTDMGPDDRYKGFPGGLYPDDSNKRPEAHEQAGRKLARQIRPLNAEGQPDAQGKIVLLTIGFSNTLQCSKGLIAAVKEDSAVAPQVVVVNGAHGGRSAFMIQNPEDHAIGEEYWQQHVAGRLADAQGDGRPGAGGVAQGNRRPAAPGPASGVGSEGLSAAHDAGVSRGHQEPPGRVDPHRAGHRPAFSQREDGLRFQPLLRRLGRARRRQSGALLLRDGLCRQVAAGGAGQGRPAS